jgi:hypothetical protein
MKKYGLMLVLLIIIALVISAWLLKAPVFSSYLTNKMGVPVSVGNIAIRPSKTKMKNFRINNPRKFKKDAAFKVKHAEIDYNFHHLFGNPIELDQIALDGVYLNIEITNAERSESNWTVIGSKLAKNENTTGKEVIIHKLILTHITVEVSGLGLVAGLAVPKVQYFDRWEFDEIDSQHGFPTEDLIQKIFGKAGLLNYIQGIFNQGIQKTLSPMRIFGTERILDSGDFCHKAESAR